MKKTIDNGCHDDITSNNSDGYSLRCIRESVRIRNCITAFLCSDRINNGLNHSIACAVLPRSRDENKGYLFELSPQVGCKMSCPFCELEPYKDSLTPEEVVSQIKILQDETRLHNIPINDPFKINFSDGGELLLNEHCMEILRAATNYLPVLVKVSTTMPDDDISKENLTGLIKFMQNYMPGVTLQVSLYSTDENIRNRPSKVPFISFARLRDIGEEWKAKHPEGRKITLTFTLTSTSHCKPHEIVNILPPELFRIRLHPYKPNNKKGISTMSIQRCKEICAAFEKCGYTTDLEWYHDWEFEQMLMRGVLRGETLHEEDCEKNPEPD